MLKKVKILKLNPADYPDSLRQMPGPPQQLFWAGVDIKDVMARPRVAIVGSRRATGYGRNITEDFARKLASADVVIVSGLAYGIDSCAHKGALAVGGCTVAVLPSPIDKIYPAANHSLAEQILKTGGALASECPVGTEVNNGSFIARNRIVSALADVLLITEAAKQSGTLHTVRFALEQGKTVMAVPGNINSPTSEGCNNLIKSGAQPATNVEDVFFALNLQPKPVQPIRIFQGSPSEQLILDLIQQGVQAQEQLALSSKLPGPQVSSTLTSLELQGYIRPTGGGYWTLS